MEFYKSEQFSEERSHKIIRSQPIRSPEMKHQHKQMSAYSASIKILQLTALDESSLKGALNKEKALEGAFSNIVKFHVQVHVEST